MKNLVLPLIALMLMSLASCNPWKYVGEYDHKADFTTYKTFGLLNWEKHNNEYVDSETKQWILLAIKDQLEKRGYTYQKSEANLQVSVFMIINEETSYSAYQDQYAGYAGYGGVAVGVGVGSDGSAGVGAYGYGINPYPYTMVKHDYEEGAFVIDLLDHKQKKIVWQGLAHGRLSRDKPTQLSVQDRVNRIFKTFPLKPVKK